MSLINLNSILTTVFTTIVITELFYQLIRRYTIKKSKFTQGESKRVFEDEKRDMIKNKDSNKKSSESRNPASFNPNKELSMKYKYDGKVNAVLFFPDYSLSCPLIWREAAEFLLEPIKFEPIGKKCFKKNGECKFRHLSHDVADEMPLRELMQLMLKTRHSIDICVWILSLRYFANVIIELKQQ